MASKEETLPDQIGSSPADEAALVALAQRAFENYYSRCFWFMDKSLVITNELLPQIIHGLRSHGDREAFLIADQLCR